MDKEEHRRETEVVDEEKPLKKARYLWQVKDKKTAKVLDQDQPCCSSAPGPPGEFQISQLVFSDLTALRSSFPI